MAEKLPSANDRLAALEAKIQAGPEAVSTTQGPRLLGPPKEYYDRQDFQWQPGFVPHTEADMWTPAGMPSEARARIKAKMNSVGLYGEKGYTPGAWTPDDANAWQTILETANAAGIRDPEEALDRYSAEAMVKSPKVKAPRAPLVTRLYDQQAIRMTVQDSARKILGQALPDEEADRIMSAYQAYDAATQRNLYNAQTPEGPGGTVTQAMSPEEYARTEVERARPVEAGSQRYLDAFDKIVGSLGTMVKPPDLYGGGQ